MSDEIGHWKKYKLRYYLCALFFIGVLGVLSFGPTGTLPVPYVEHAFLAISISAFIAFFIEVALHQDFARNVFEASIGYLLPEALRGELRWIYDQKFLCEKHTQNVTIRRIKGTSFVVVHTELVRVFRNITADIQRFGPGLGVWERFIDGYPVKILSYTCQHDGKVRGPNLATKCAPDALRGPVLSMGKLDEIPVESGKRLTAALSFEETFSENDLAYSHFGAPTKDVTVTVDCDDTELDIDVRFSHRNGDPKITHVGDRVWILEGPLLPLQGIRIFWFRKDKYEAWRASYEGG